MDALLNDVRYALRMLLKAPGLTVVAMLTLALGLTVNATVFFFVSDFFLRPLPAKDPERLVVLAQKSSQSAMPFPFSYPDFMDFRRSVDGTSQEYTGMSQAFSNLIAYQAAPVHLSRTGEASERTWVHAVSSGYFTLLGVQPLQGRLFLPREGRQPGADPIIVLTYNTWRGRFNADPRLIGQPVKINGLPFTVVGVTPPGFYGAAWGMALSGFVPATMLGEMMPAQRDLLNSRGNTGFFMMGRLHPTASLEQARSAASRVMARLVRDYPDSHPPALAIKALVLRERMSRPVPFVATYMPLIISVLMALALLVLAVAVANVANLLYARITDRERELAIRGALGASRWRLLRQLLVESVLLALGAGALGTGAALWISPYLSTIGPGASFPPPAYTGRDWRLFVFSLGVSLATGILTGLLPALQATRLSIQPLLKEGAQAVARGKHPLRSLLVIGQVALSCLVLICAGLAIRSLHELSRVNLGFQPSNLLLVSFDLGLQRYSSDQGRQFHRRLLEKVRALPGVRDASFAEHVPFDIMGGLTSGISAEGRPTANNSQFQLVACPVVDDVFLKTVGIRIIDGRDFTTRDDASAPRVAIINRILARQLWAEENPVGKRLLIGKEPLEVAGIIGDGRFWSITDENRPLLFRPLAQNYRDNVTLTVRTQGNPIQLTPVVERIVRELDPDLPLSDVRTMEQQLARSPLGFMPLRAGAIVAGAQGAIALLLAALGIFGLVSFAVSRRTREIGIRMALGARAVNVIQLVTRQSIKLTVIGLACGLISALGLTQTLATLLYGINPTDMAVFVGVVLLIAAITLLAAWLPARRATRVDPMVALRSE